MPITETIKFNESEGKDGFAIRKDCKIVEVFGSKSSQRVTSSKVKVTNVVDYNWDTQQGNGRLMHPHCGGNFIAYSVKVNNTGAVRIVDLQTNDRILMRGAQGLIRDLEFMHKLDEMYLGFIDEYGSFYVYKIKMPTNTEKMESQLVIQVNIQEDTLSPRSEGRRFIWCKYVPDESSIGSTPDYAFHFAVCQNNEVYVSNVNLIVEKHGEGTHLMHRIQDSFLKIDIHSDIVVDASFAPDGTALATASRDGSVKFFQVYLIGGETPRCLYSWTPHDGAPVSRIFFLDDHSLTGTTTEGQYWKYMITAGPNFSELKLWTCQSWKCIQTINFITPMQSARMEVNINSKFVVLSDFHRKMMYIMHVDEDVDKGAAFKWMNEFSLPVGMLGFNVINAEVVNHTTLIKRGFEHYVSEESNEDACIVDIILVQPKSLMEASVAFRPPTTYSQPNGRISSRISFDESVSFKGEEEDADVTKPDILKSKSQSPKNTPSNGSTRALTPTRIPMLSPHFKSKSPTPKEKSPHRRSVSPGRRSGSGSDASVVQLSQQLSSLIGVGKASPGSVTGHNDNSQIRRDIKAPPSDTIRVRNDTEEGSISNASSSPSREVEEILSPKNIDQTIPKNDLSYHGLDPPFIVNNLDIEGNILEPEPIGFSKLTNTQHRVTPGKTKSLGSGELVPQLPQVLAQVNSIMDMMKAQQEEMKDLKREVSRLNLKSPTEANETWLNRAVANFDAMSQTSLNRVERTIKNSMEQVVLDKKQLPSNFTETMTLSLALAVKTEMESRILPQLLKSLDPLQSHLTGEINKLMSTVDKSLKQHMKQLLTSHEFKNTWVPDLSAAIKTTCDVVMTQVVSNTIVPSFDKTLNAVFQQVNESFMKGTREYLNNFETAAKTDRTAYEELLKNQLSGMQDALSSIFQVELESQLLQSVNSIQGGITRQMESLLNRELNKAFKEQQNFLELSIPRSITPAVSVSDQLAASSPMMDPAVRKAQLMQMIDMGDAPGAFGKAASYGDTKLLIELARKVNPTEVFVKSLPVNAQLSIVQQMACDMTTDTETKLSYLQTALGTLNLSDPQILRSLARIVPVFQASVSRFITSNPDSSLMGAIKLLEMTFFGITYRLQQQQQLIPVSSGHQQR